MAMHRDITTKESVMAMHRDITTNSSKTYQLRHVRRTQNMMVQNAQRHHQSLAWLFMHCLCSSKCEVCVLLFKLFIHIAIAKQCPIESTNLDFQSTHI